MSTMTINSNLVVSAYRKAAQELFGISEQEARECIYTPDSDLGGWASDSLGIINFEHGYLPDYWSSRHFDDMTRLGNKSGTGTYVEDINAGVAAIWVA